MCLKHGAPVTGLRASLRWRWRWGGLLLVDLYQFQRRLTTGFRFLLHGAAGHLIAEPALHLSLIHISEPTRQAEISYAVFCLKKKTTLGSSSPIRSPSRIHRR